MNQASLLRLTEPRSWNRNKRLLKLASHHAPFLHSPKDFLGLIPNRAGLRFDMKTAQGRTGKISDHFGGLGTVTRQMVEQRARELAVINGRESRHFTEDDWVQAKHEMIGDQDQEETQPEESVVGLTRWDEDPGTSGHHVENNLPQDEQTLAERLVHEGLEEANHDQMLNGSKSGENQG